MEASEDQQVRLQVCERCFEHQTYDSHSEKQYQTNFQQFSLLVGQIGLKIARNVPPKYLKKASNTKNSTKRYVDTNTGKIVDFPAKGSFQVYYKSILVYSKLHTLTFPDIPFLSLILKSIKILYATNSSVLDALQKFRDIEYEWKKNTMLADSLYNYIRLNACGNDTQKCVNDIFMGLIENNLDQSKCAKKKVIYPYSIYDGKEKKNKIQSIYCPKTGVSEYFTHRSTSSNFAGRRFAKKDDKEVRPQTGFQRLKNTPSSFSWNQKPSGIIVKNLGKNRIFQLVIKEENKNFNQQKLKQLVKTSDLTLHTERKDSKNSSKSVCKFNLKAKVSDREEKLKLWSLNKEKKHNEIKGKQIYVAHLQSIKQKNRALNAKLHLNLRKNGETDRKENILTERKTNGERSLSSSRFGSIRKNITGRLEAEAEARQGCAFQLVQDLEDQNVKVIEENKQVHLQNEAQNEEREIIPGSKSQVKRSRCLKQSQYLRNRTSGQSNVINKDQLMNGENEEPGYQKKNETQQNNSNLQIKSDVSLSDSMRGSRQKRASIEEATVQKRISDRKRSSNHERYPHQKTSKSNLMSKSIVNEKMFNDLTNVDPVLDGSSSNENEDQWQKMKEDYSYIREPAQIIKKFVQEENFIQCNSYSTRYDELVKSPSCPEVQFKITGEELINRFTLASIRSICKPSQIRLFPEIFKQIQNGSMVSNGPSEQPTNESRFNISHLTYHSSKLMHVVNLMLRSNPMMISRIFEDKKNLNPYGVYCIWLRTCFGRFEPVFVNDSFAFEQHGTEGRMKPVYSWLSNQNSIWYMLLEKAIAKVLGGYHLINELSLAQLMSVIMGSPTVDIGYINPLKAIKVFDQKIFYNKMVSVYTLRQSSSGSSLASKEGGRVDRIIGFSYNKRDPKESAVSIKVEESTLTVLMRQFLQSYGEIALLFFNNNYFLNQTPLVIQKGKHSVISCRLVSSHSKNNCYLMFSRFPQKSPTKVTLYRQLSDDEAKIREGMNPLSEEDRKYEYIGEIFKTGNFFFEVQVNGGQYICLMENSYDQPPFLSLFSQYPINVKEICSNELLNTQKQKMKRLKKKTEKELRVLKEENKTKELSYETPKVLIEHRIHVNRFKQEKAKKQKNNQNVPPAQIKIKRQYAYQPDNLYEIDIEEQELEGPKKSKSKCKQKRKAGLKQIKEENSECNTIGTQMEGEIKQSVLGNKSRIIDNYN